MTYTQTESTTRGSEFARPKQIFQPPDLDWPRLYDILRLVETADGDQVNNADGFFEFAFGCLISGEYPATAFHSQTRMPCNDSATTESVCGPAAVRK
jgi:hypothetical protein